MLIFWGSQSRMLDLGADLRLTCEACGETGPFRLFLRYSCSHVYFVFGMVTEKEYVLRCEACADAFSAKEEAVEAHLPRNPIPLNERYGCLWFVVAIALLLVVLLAAAAFRDDTSSSKPRPYRVRR